MMSAVDVEVKSSRLSAGGPVRVASAPASLAASSSSASSSLDRESAFEMTRMGRSSSMALMGTSSLFSAESRSANRMSFKSSEEFFHCMLSYRVRSEGPPDKGGNNLARLIYDTCCSADEINSAKNPTSGSHDLLLHALGNFGKWPKAFSGKTEPMRVFLDQVNLRMGVPWKGSGDAESGGFLGAVSQTLLLVPLFSASPVRFKISCVESSAQRFALACPINIKLADGSEMLSIYSDEATGVQTIREHTCEGIQPDGSFQLSAVSQDLAAIFPSKFEFFCPTNFLPSDGTGPRGSLADLLSIQQHPEDLTFSVASYAEGRVVLQVNQLSDHVFFPNELISLCTSVSDDFESFKIVQVICQGSKSAALHSKICIDSASQTQIFAGFSSPVQGVTKETDRCDNFLMELMLSRALRSLTASGKLHPCKLIMPVFVDDMESLYPLANRLSENYSGETSSAAQKALESILKRPLTRIEERQWIHASVKEVIKFFFEFQGIQLSDRSNRLKSIKDKASIVRTHIVATSGMEANNEALFQYTANNPLAFELLDFLDGFGLIYLQPTLVKHDITSVKEFSLLTQHEIRIIANHSHELSSRPLVKETVEISRAVSAAQGSKLILPVSKRLELFEDKDASFLTVIYSPNALSLALQKPFFSLGFQITFFLMVASIGVFQSISDPVINMPFIIPNFTRALWMLSSMIFVFAMKSVKAAVRSYIFWSFATGVMYVLGFIIDKTINGKYEPGESMDCASRNSPQLDSSNYKNCVYGNYIFFGFNAFFYFALEYSILFRQNILWRCLAAGISIQFIMAAALSPSAYTVMGCIVVPLMLLITETLRFYGNLQAFRITKGDSVVNSQRWKQVLSESRQDLEDISRELLKSYNCTVLDRSAALGKWRPGTSVAVQPPSVRQPIHDFDELYNSACAVNSTFQAWIESFFVSDLPSSIFLYFDDHQITDNLKHQLHFEHFHGVVTKGPVKHPERSIAKVCYVTRRSWLIFESAAMP